EPTTCLIERTTSGFQRGKDPNRKPVVTETDYVVDANTNEPMTLSPEEAEKYAKDYNAVSQKYPPVPTQSRYNGLVVTGSVKPVCDDASSTDLKKLKIMGNEAEKAKQTEKQVRYRELPLGEKIKNLFSFDH